MTPVTVSHPPSCPGCLGSGACWVCLGSGHHGPDPHRRCDRCNGTGHCAETAAVNVPAPRASGLVARIRELAS